MSRTRSFRLSLVLAGIACASSSAIADGDAALPATPKRPVTDTYVGTAGPRKVVDDYRWLESLDDPVVKDWVAAENAATRARLDASPSRAAIRDELKRLSETAPITRSALAYAGGRLFALKRQPPKNQPLLVAIDGADGLGDGPVDHERVVVDPNLRNEKGTTAIDWFVPSRDGRLVAVSLSDNGSEQGTLRIFDAATGEERSDIVPRVQNPTGGGSVAWNADGTGLWYTRYPAPMERPVEDAGFYQQVWFHRLGTRAAFDTRVLGPELPRIAEVHLEASEDGRHVLADVENGDGGDHGFWLRGPDDAWRRIAGFDDGFRAAMFGRDGRLYAIATKGSPHGRVVSMKVDAPTFARAATVVPESDAVVERVVPTASRLYVSVLSGGPSTLRVYTLSGRALPAPSVEPVSQVAIGARLARDTILYGSQSFVTPFAWYRLDARNVAVRTLLSGAPDLPTDDLAVTRITATSGDGTAVPVNVVARKGIALDGSHPTLLTAYGGYGLSQRPRFSSRTLFWLRHGGVFAVANVRGGGEFGEAWHEAGNLVRKQNVFDDFGAAARTLVARGYTTPAKLAIEGRSNGGLLMGAALVQHPGQYGAVVSHVGIYDMLRVELTPNGAFNVTEFGTVKDPAQFDALFAYSPYHHVDDARRYPPVLLTTGIHDGRVDPWQSLKFAARMQAVPNAGPVLLRVAGDAGHGQGRSAASTLELDADTFAFLFDSLGMSAAVSTVSPADPVVTGSVPPAK